MAAIIEAGKIAHKKVVCESFGFYEAGKVHLWRERLRQIRKHEGDQQLFKMNWLSPKEIAILVKHLGKPSSYVETSS